MACFHFSLLHWIKTLLPNNRPSCPTSGPDLELGLEYPPSVIRQNTIEPTHSNGDADLSKYQSPRPIPTSYTNLPFRPSGDTIVLPGPCEDIFESSFNETSPLPNLCNQDNGESTVSEVCCKSCTYWMTEKE